MSNYPDGRSYNIQIKDVLDPENIRDRVRFIYDVPDDPNNPDKKHQEYTSYMPYAEAIEKFGQDYYESWYTNKPNDIGGYDCNCWIFLNKEAREKNKDKIWSPETQNKGNTIIREGKGRGEEVDLR